MKKILVVAIIAMLLGFKNSDKEVSKILIGTWQWDNMIDIESGEEMGMDMFTMGMDIEIKTQFKEDGTYIEYKTKLEGEGMSENKGEWKLEEDDTVLNMNAKGKWRPSKIIAISETELLIEMRPGMGLKMVKE